MKTPFGVPIVRSCDTLKTSVGNFMGSLQIQTGIGHLKEIKVEDILKSIWHKKAQQKTILHNPPQSSTLRIL